MRKNIIIAVLSSALVISILINIISQYFTNFNFVEKTDGDIDQYMNMLDGYIPESGYVPDAKSAAKIGKVIFETMFNTKGGKYVVEFDEEEQMWIVRNVSILRNGVVVVIQKSDGKIVRAWGYK